MKATNHLTSLINSRNYACWYDKIEILSKQSKCELKKLLPIDVLERESYLFKIIWASKSAKICGYLSKIIATVPTPTLFEQLLKNLADYKITYIEISMDIFCDSEHQAEAESLYVLQHFRKKYCRAPKIKDYRGSTEKMSAKAIHEGLFSQVTGYFGSNNFKLSQYARPSKLNGIPCIHIEFRIRGHQIKKRTEIASLTDLLAFDPEDFFMKEIENVVFESIDDHKLGKWILDALGSYTVNGKRNDMRISLAASTFLNLYEITSSTQLIDYFRSERKKIQRQRGHRNRWQKKMLKLRTPSYFLRSL
jgi:hypothetical protein